LPSTDDLPAMLSSRLLVGVALLAVLAGCAGGPASDAGSTTTTDDPQTATPTARPPDPGESGTYNSFSFRASPASPADVARALATPVDRADERGRDTARTLVENGSVVATVVEPADDGVIPSDGPLEVGGLVRDDGVVYRVDGEVRDRTEGEGYRIEVDGPLRPSEDEYDTAEEQAVAVENLSTAERDQLAMRLNASLSESLRAEGGRPNTDTVNKSRSATQLMAREMARTVASKAADRATRRAYRKTMRRSFSAMPSGLPLAPVPGYWYATTNVWHVDVEGEYARFGVRASQGRPTTPGGEFRYVRDGESVTLDVDQDGQRERLGRATKVRFNVSATVPVVVPPGKTGVGDVDGVMVEKSAGWPDPGGE